MPPTTTLMPKCAQANQTFYEFMVPWSRAIVPKMSLKSPAWAYRCMAVWASSRKPGAAQHYRDAKIPTIYEGTTAIQATTWSAARPRVMAAGPLRPLPPRREDRSGLIASGTDTAKAVARNLAPGPVSGPLCRWWTSSPLRQGRPECRLCRAASPSDAHRQSDAAGSWAARCWLVELLAKGQDTAFMQAKLATAQFYAEHILTRVPGQADAAVTNGAASDGIAHGSVLIHFSQNT